MVHFIIKVMQPGFLDLDAFNYQSKKQDLGLVALASIYPTKRYKKLIFRF